MIELRLDGAHAATAKLRAWRNPQPRRGTFRFQRIDRAMDELAAFRLQNMKRPLVGDIGAAIEDVATGVIAHLRRHYSQPMSVVGDINRALICASPGTD